jgi:ribosomal protein S7
MMNGRNNGKKLLATRIVAHAFEIIHIMTDQNPIQVAVDAIVNCGPREDSTRIGSAGTVRRQAVDVSPLRRVNQSIALLTIGAREASFRNIKSVSECLAEELINAAKGSSVSFPSIPSVNCIKSSLEYGSCLRILSLAYSIFCLFFGFYSDVTNRGFCAITEQLRYQEEGRARACRQEQPVKWELGCPFRPLFTHYGVDGGFVPGFSRFVCIYVSVDSVTEEAQSKKERNWMAFSGVDGMHWHEDLWPIFNMKKKFCLFTYSCDSVVVLNTSRSVIDHSCLAQGGR